jgi:hypothetical protein
MPSSVQEGEFKGPKSPVGFVDTTKFYPTPLPPASENGKHPDTSVDMADYLEHQFDPPLS